MCVYTRHKLWYIELWFTEYTKAIFLLAHFLLVQRKYKSGLTHKKPERVTFHFFFLERKKNGKEKCEQREIKKGTTSNCCPT